MLVCVAETIYHVSFFAPQICSIPDYRQTQSSFECSPLLNLARIPDHQMSRLYNRFPRLLPLDNSDRLPGFCCSDGLVAGEAPLIGPLVSASGPDISADVLEAVVWTYRQSTPKSPNKLLDTL
jgi:hypothetical protein